MTLYGPVLDSMTGHKPVTLERKTLLCPAPPTPCPDFAAVSDYDVLVAPSGHPREVWVSMPLDAFGNPQPFTNFYKYRVKPRIDSGVTDLRSADTFASPDPNVDSFEYICWIASIYCGGNRAEGGEDILTTVDNNGGYLTLDSWDWLVEQDLTGDGQVDEADLAELMERLGVS